MNGAMSARPAEEAEIDHLAQLWHQGWHDAHGKLAPEGLVRARTLDTFRDRLAAALEDTRVIGPAGAPLGLCMIKDDELYQLYVAREARGSGIAAALIADGEARLVARGFATAWLACAIGNDRAARFYEKCGWAMAREAVNRLETPAGVFEVAIWRYEKAVRPEQLR
jgi:ribosomal protein S18 acetylase RimI-like enzyme